MLALQPLPQQSPVLLTVCPVGVGLRLLGELVLQCALVAGTQFILDFLLLSCDAGAGGFVSSVVLLLVQSPFLLVPVNQLIPVQRLRPCLLDGHLLGHVAHFVPDSGFADVLGVVLGVGLGHLLGHLFLLVVHFVDLVRHLAACRVFLFGSEQPITTPTVVSLSFGAVPRH